MIIPIVNFVYYKLPRLNDNKIITAGPTKTITAKDNNCPITCQLIIVEFIPFTNY